MLCIALRILAGASYLDLSSPYGLSVSSVYLLLEECLKALNVVLKKILFPETYEKCQSESCLFMQKRKSPIFGIIGAIEIEKPLLSNVQDPQKYMNRKGFFAIVAQVVVNGD